jgi:hypothetical protein
MRKWDEKWYDGSVAPIGQDTKCGKDLGKSLGGSQWLPRGKSSCKG